MNVLLGKIKVYLLRGCIRLVEIKGRGGVGGEGSKIKESPPSTHVFAQGEGGGGGGGAAKEVEGREGQDKSKGSPCVYPRGGGGGRAKEVELLKGRRVKEVIENPSPVCLCMPYSCAVLLQGTGLLYSRFWTFTCIGCHVTTRKPIAEPGYIIQC